MRAVIYYQCSTIPENACLLILYRRPFILFLREIVTSTEVHVQTHAAKNNIQLAPPRQIANLPYLKEFINKYVYCYKNIHKLIYSSTCWHNLFPQSTFPSVAMAHCGHKLSNVCTTNCANLSNNSIKNFFFRHDQGLAWWRKLFIFSFLLCQYNIYSYYIRVYIIYMRQYNTITNTQ